MSTNSISFYIKECIACSYDSAGLANVTGHAHDVRKVAAALRSLTNPSLDDVMVSGDWSSPDTFFKHYFFNIDREIVSATGHISKTGRIITACDAFFNIKRNRIS